MLNRLSVLVLVVFLLMLAFVPIVKGQDTKPCPYVYDGFESRLRESSHLHVYGDIPDQLVHDYIDTLCALDESVSMRQSAYEIWQAQKAFNDVEEVFHTYLSQYSPIEPADVETIEEWLEMVDAADIIPESFTVSDGEPICAPQITLEPSDCYVPLQVTADEFVGMVIFEGMTYRQDYGSFLVSRSCDSKITAANIREAWDCEVSWIVQFRNEEDAQEERLFTEYAMLNHDWQPVR